MTKQPNADELSEDLRSYLESVEPLTQADVARLEKAAADLNADPGFQAELVKGLFVERILQALEERGESQSALAKRWGKSRQYLCKLLNEDKRVNFTIETMCEVVHHLGRRLEILVLRPDEVANVATYFPSDWATQTGHGRGVVRAVEVNLKVCGGSDVRPSDFGSADSFNFAAATIANEPTCLAA